MSKTRILFNWKPHQLQDVYSLKEQFQELMTTKGFTVWGLEVRDPARNIALAYNNTGPHHDLPGAPFLVLWSNIRPTQVRLADGELLQGVQDGDVVLVDNFIDTHCRPANQQDRWFIRGFIKA